MADEPRTQGEERPTAPPQQPQPQQPQVQQIQIPLDASTLTTAYVNWFRFTGSDEELIIDLGLTPQLGQLLVPQANQPQPEPIKLNHRAVMSFHTAKRLLQYLQRAVSLYESRYGALEVDPRLRARINPTGQPRQS